MLSSGVLILQAPVRLWHVAMSVHAFASSFRVCCQTRIPVKDCMCLQATSQSNSLSLGQKEAALCKFMDDQWLLHPDDDTGLVGIGVRSLADQIVAVACTLLLKHRNAAGVHSGQVLLEAGKPSSECILAPIFPVVGSPLDLELFLNHCCTSWRAAILRHTACAERLVFEVLTASQRKEAAFLQAQVRTYLELHGLLLGLDLPEATRTAWEKIL